MGEKFEVMGERVEVMGQRVENLGEAFDGVGQMVDDRILSSGLVSESSRFFVPAYRVRIAHHRTIHLGI